MTFGPRQTRQCVNPAAVVSSRAEKSEKKKMSHGPTLVTDRKTGELRPCKRCSDSDSLRCAQHPESSDIDCSSTSSSSPAGLLRWPRTPRRRSPSRGCERSIPVGGGGVYADKKVELKRGGGSDRDSSPSARGERKVELRKTRTAVAAPKSAVAKTATGPGLDALPDEIQALILSRLTADELALVTAASDKARRMVAANERRCALGNRRCSNYWRDEFERTRMAAVRASPEYRAYVAALPADEKAAVDSDAAKSASATDTVQNALCRLGCEQRATATLEPYVQRVFAEPYPVAFGLLREWPRRGLYEISFTLARRGGTVESPSEYALVVGLVWDAPRPWQITNRLEYDATVAYLKTDAAAGIADAAFRVETGVARWYVTGAQRYMLAPTFECVYAGPATALTAHRIAQVIANLVFTFGDSLTMYADRAKRAAVLGAKQDVLQTRFLIDTEAFARAVSSAFGRLPVLLWNPSRSVVSDLQRSVGAAAPANWTFASANPATPFYNSVEHILAPRRPPPPPRHEP